MLLDLPLPQGHPLVKENLYQTPIGLWDVFNLGLESFDSLFVPVLFDNGMFFDQERPEIAGSTVLAQFLDHALQPLLTHLLRPSKALVGLLKEVYYLMYYCGSPRTPERFGSYTI